MTAKISSPPTDGFTNARTRILGNRTGPAAELVIATVKGWRTMTAVGWHWIVVLASVVTPLGWLVVLSITPALVFGYQWSWTALVVFGFGGITLVVIGSGYLIRGARVVAAVTIVQSRVVAGDHAVGTVRVTNNRRFRSSATIIEVPIATGLTELSVPSLASSADFTRDFSIPALRRGKILIGPARTIRADPAGVVRHSVSWGEPVELFVHPKTLGISSLSSGVLRDLEGNPTTDLSDSDVSFHALREYQPGDDRRYIHWKSTAKTGVHMVRQFEETRRSHIMIALSVASGDYATAEEFELAVSAAGSLAIRAIRDVREVSVVVGEKTPEFARRKNRTLRNLNTISRTRLLDDLTVVVPAENALTILDVARVAGLGAIGVSLTFLICGSTVSSAALRTAALGFPLGVTVIALVCDPEASPSVRKIAGFWVLTIGFLEDLASALSQVSPS